ncbi:hypothetical protein SAMN04488516_101479 [Desulfonauticus submarinus]|uniref:Uncharacterized protein n=1 Tax=Desulfonauticus submarinus TaxID=206665 RepID=A0A1H0APD8_9BACT|nr:hypothetical protein [Desulfonauticus submarinus]SDN34786.1 hypothetical protein SAMN04488516_101479 [Desulfonauticus submarinus]
MNVTILTAIIGVVAGAIGWWITTFWMQPILRYRNIKYKILMNFIYYAQVINADELNSDMKNLYRERVLANRQTSSELAAAIEQLPGWYKKWLRIKGYDPQKAAKNLIGFSNTKEYDQSNRLEGLIRKQLGLPPKT